MASNNAILKSMVICCSNFDEITKEEIKHFVNQLGGKYKINMTKDTKVLISNKINTDKCLVNLIIYI